MCMQFGVPYSLWGFPPGVVDGVAAGTVIAGEGCQVVVIPEVENEEAALITTAIPHSAPRSQYPVSESNST